jgi:hypothetical protein
MSGLFEFWPLANRVQSIESLQASLSSTQTEGVHIVRTFIGVNRVQVDHVANDMVFVVNAIAAVHIARHAGNI